MRVRVRGDIESAIESESESESESERERESESESNSESKSKSEITESETHHVITCMVSMGAAPRAGSVEEEAESPDGGEEVG